ncbi:MAG: hypothetical protein Q8K60_07740 [Parachlamydiaceae bacterium]|nr:hypothetical protein [Parachlamydiaceae bacterium]
MSYYLQRALIALCLFSSILLMSSCSLNDSSRIWEYNEIQTKNPSFNGGRLILCSDIFTSNLELEIFRSKSGIRMYLNILSMQAFPCSDDSQRTDVNIVFLDEENQETWVVRPIILQGGQRLLFSDSVSECLIQALLDERPFDIKIGRICLRVITDNFSEVYSQLMNLTIENN